MTSFEIGQEIATQDVLTKSQETEAPLRFKVKKLAMQALRCGGS